MPMTGSNPTPSRRERPELQQARSDFPTSLPLCESITEIPRLVRYEYQVCVSQALWPPHPHQTTELGGFAFCSFASASRCPNRIHEQIYGEICQNIGFLICSFAWAHHHKDHNAQRPIGCDVPDVLCNVVTRRSSITGTYWCR